uniref:Uncharacterized protein n=1 Tax=Hucho hucho TaxID=62062 RepID=A0A4W5L4J5_9TELE
MWWRSQRACPSLVEFLSGLSFHTINWFREVVNAFCSQKDPEMKMKVVTRLQNITYLQTLLERTLAEIPGYAPLANFDGESTEGAPVSSSTAVPKKGNIIYLRFPEMRIDTYCGGCLAEGTGKKRKAPAKNSSADNSQLEEGTEAEETQQDHPEKVQEASRPGVSLVSYCPFRELDMEVLSVLQCGLLSRLSAGQ